jgi:hypothetical protein
MFGIRARDMEKLLFGRIERARFASLNEYGNAGRYFVTQPPSIEII